MNKLTGKTRHRQGWFGRLILQVEEKQHRVDFNGGFVDVHDVIVWRDAKVEDLRNPFVMREMVIAP